MGKEIGAVVERYQVPVGTRPIIRSHPGWVTGGEAHRFWVHERVLVGGTILGLEDGQRLRREHGVTHVLSFETENTDWGKGFLRSETCWTPFVDDAEGPHPGLLDEALEFAFQALRTDGNLYVHCQLGGSRGPTAGYLICTGILGMDREEVLAILKKAHRNGSTPYAPYLQAVDEAVVRWRMKWTQ